MLAVRDGAGWHLGPYTNNGESLLPLASNFTVTLDHPTAVLMPATGTSTETPGASGRTVTTATATKVREFAWAAGPFVKITGTSPGGIRVNIYRDSGISSTTAVEHAVDRQRPQWTLTAAASAPTRTARWTR